MKPGKRGHNFVKKTPQKALYEGRVVDFNPEKRRGVLAVISSNGIAVTERVRIFFYMRHRRDYRKNSVEGDVFDEATDTTRQPIKGETICFYVSRELWRGRKEQYKAKPWDFVQDSTFTE